MSGWPTLPLGLAGALLADDEIASLFTAEAEIDAMLAFEHALARAQHAVGDIDDAALARIEAAARPESLDRAGLLAGMARDGLAVPSLVKQLRAAIGEPHAAAFHRGSTSQDVIDTALMLRLKPAIGVLLGRVDSIVRDTEALGHQYASHPVMARTRFQDALPFTMGDRIETWVTPLKALRSDAPKRFPLQIGGAIGLREAAYGPNADRIAALMAQDLALDDPGRSWHTDRRAIGAIMSWCAALATALGKIGIDVALMAQTPLAEIQAPGGGSSAMPHKNNPVGAELLVSLSRFVGGHAAMVQQASLHENERSGIAWTEEWFAVPQVVVGCGAAARGAATLIPQLRPKRS
ncbi:MAG: lyase family protein [Pseudomonadota bacterium]